MLHVSVTNKFLPGTREMMALTSYYIESFSKEKGGTIGDLTSVM